jgi:cell wall-associated NlpC family hydrolase
MNSPPRKLLRMSRLLTLTPRAIAFAGLLCLAVSAHAVPDATSDVSVQLVQDKNLSVIRSEASPPSTSTPRSLVAEVRESTSTMVNAAMGFLGVRYSRGGQSAETGFDCSGFTRFVFESSVGLLLPRKADEQARTPTLKRVQRDELLPGDLVFFNTLKRTFSHVGIYVGEGKFIHSPRSGSQVRVEDMRIKYWAKRFTGARRADVPPSAAPLAAPVATPTPTPKIQSFDGSIDFTAGPPAFR